MNKGTIAASFALGAALAFGAVTLLKTQDGAPLYSVVMPDLSKEIDDATSGLADSLSQEASKAPDANQDAVDNAKMQTEQEADAASEQEVAGLSQDAEGEREAPSETFSSVSVPQFPSFDIVRVERDGSAVIAGRAPSESAVELLSGGRVIGKAKANRSGEFAIVLDEPLATGDHEITLRAKPEASQAVTSQEIAVVRLPEAQQGAQQAETLVIISKEGDASRILQGPGEETALVSPEAAETQQQGPTDLTEEAAGTARETENAADAETTTETSTEVASLPQTPEEDQVSPTEDASVNPSGDAAAGSAPQQEAAPKEAPAPAPGQSPTETTATIPVLVRAIDVETDRMFIAGSGAPETTVRIYINSAYKGEAQIASNGAFLFELAEGLVPGRHDLRADQVDGDGAVLSRAQVFVDHLPQLALADTELETADHKTGKTEQAVEETDTNSSDTETARVTSKDSEAVGVAAPQDDDASASVRQPDGDPDISSDPGSGQETTPSVTDGENELASTKTRSGDDPQVAKTELPTSTSGNAGDVNETTSGPAGNAQSAPETPAAKAEPDTPPVTSSAETAEVPDASAVAPLVTAEKDDQTPAKSSANAGESEPVNDETASVKPDLAQAAPSSEDDDAATGEADARPVLETGRSVIIRRGDNLWRVSRRMFGAGRKYTLIFDANSDQIRDPALIFPGQVFSIPEDPEAKTGDADSG